MCVHLQTKGENGTDLWIPVYELLLQGALEEEPEPSACGLARLGCVFQVVPFPTLGPS